MTEVADAACAQAAQAWSDGDFPTAIRLLRRVLARFPHHISAHYLVFDWIWDLAPDRAEALAAEWAEAFLPGLGVDACEDVMLETFADHPERYPLFLRAGNFEARRGRHERAEALFSGCLVPPGERPAAAAGTVADKYDHQAGEYDANHYHVETSRLFMAAASARLAGKSGLVAVDAACGTGGLAEALRPFAARLIGIDLSPGMIEHARPRYDQVMVGDLVAGLNGLGRIADLVTCCGATYYFDDLAPFLAAAAAALVPGGLLLFSDYAAPDGAGTMVTLGGTRRFCHDPEQVRAQAAAAGLLPLGHDHGLSYGMPVRYWCFVRAG